MRFSASVRLTLKDRPKDYRGITSESYTLGEHGPLGLASMMVAFLSVASEMYSIFCAADELNQELDDLRTALEGIKFEPEQD